jgi:hypothetical protein
VAGVDMRVHSGSSLTIVEAGIARAGWLWSRQTIALDGFATDKLGGGFMPLPAAISAGRLLYVWVERDQAIERGADSARSYAAWVTTGSGRMVRSAGLFSLEPAEAPQSSASPQ